MKLPFFLAQRFIAGEDFESALPAIRELTDKGLFVTLDLLGVYIKDRNVAARARDAYIDLIRVVDASRNFEREASISIKLSMMGQKIDAGFCLDNLRQLLEAASEHNVFVRLDMEASDVTESTLSMFETVYPDHPDHVGIVLQAYLKRTERDIERMCDLKARVRICKGAYKEPSELAYQSMDVIRERFMTYTRMLLSESRYPAIATHDNLLIDATRQYVAEKGIDKDDFEFQMLFGIRRETQVNIRNEGYNMRIYVPFGTEWLPYFIRRMRQRKENVWFVLSNWMRK